MACNGLTWQFSGRFDQEDMARSIDFVYYIDEFISGIARFGWIASM